MYYPILAENNSSLTLYTTSLNAILALLTVIRTSIASKQWHPTAHVHIDIVPDICTFFAWLEVRIIEDSDNQGSDNQDWTVIRHMCAANDHVID